MTGIVGTTRDEIRAFVERIQRLDTEIKELNGDKSDIYAEAKGTGFDVKALKAVVAYLRKDPTEAEEQAAFFDLYLDAVTGTGNATRARAQEPPKQPNPAPPESQSSGSDKAANHRPNRQGKTTPPTAPMVGADLGNGSGVDPDEQITESAVPPPDTTPRDGGAAAPAATDPRSTGIDGPVLSPPSPGTGPTNSDDPYNCIPPQFDRTRELRA